MTPFQEIDKYSYCPHLCTKRGILKIVHICGLFFLFLFSLDSSWLSICIMAASVVSSETSASSSSSSCTATTSTLSPDSSNAVFANGLLNLLLPQVERMDDAIQEVQASQTKLATQMDALTLGLYSLYWFTHL